LKIFQLQLLKVEKNILGKKTMSEYMAMKVPVLASPVPVGENKFIVENRKDGFLVSNEKEWEEKIFYLIENEEARTKMGKMGRKKIEEKYSTEVCLDKLINIFKET
jgi:glycosyltransferase involved in cell wall biosynthesis